MLDLLSPLRGYIAQNLQFYLSKYIEDIQLEGLGLFGGDLVLNDLEIKRHVLRESLEIPSSFDFSRGFIRELRIHIPWTQLLSQPIEVKLYTIELILTARSRTASTTSGDAAMDRETEIDQPKSGWIHETLQKILANVSLQVNNLVLKYEHDDIVFSIALGTLDFYSASEGNSWKRSFEELKGGQRVICKRIDAKDVTIFLDRYTSDEDAKEDTGQYPLRRKVVGYEVPVLGRASASIRAKLQLFYNAAVTGQIDSRSELNSPLHQNRHSVCDSHGKDSIFDVDGLFTYDPSVLCDPFFYYSCNRSSVIPMYEVDIFIGELLFSVSDRQLGMLNQLIQSASHRFDRAHEPVPFVQNGEYSPGWGNKNKYLAVGNTPAELPQKYQVNDQVGSAPNTQQSWFSWAVNALKTAENDQEDELESELLAETRGALLERQSQANGIEKCMFVPHGPITRTLCVRVCVSLVSLTLRKHEEEVQGEYQDATNVESSEELVPVANLGMVKVSIHPRRKKVLRPAIPVLHLSLSNLALEMLLARGQEQCGTELVFEIEKAKIVSATNSTNGDDLNFKNEEMLLLWGSVNATPFYDCVPHPYFINSFFEEETTRLHQHGSRSIDVVKVTPDADILVWKTLKEDRQKMNLEDSSSAPCECFSSWNGEAVRCTSTSVISIICQNAIRTIGIKERILDGGILVNAVSTAYASSGVSLFITNELTRALTAAAGEYRVHRSPDLGALDNLARLLLPHLVALLCRYSGHSCSAASLHPSPESVDFRHRSSHSALRMRSASTLKSIEHDLSSTDHHTKEEAVTKVLDISIGAVQAVLEPLKCLVLLEVVSIFLQKNEDNVIKLMPATNNVAPTNVIPSIFPRLLSDIKLITGSNVHARLPDQHANSGQGSRSFGNLNVIVGGFSWLGSFNAGSSKNRLQLGAVTAHLDKTQSNFKCAPLVEALGLELMNTEGFIAGGTNGELVASMVKAKIDLSLSALHDVLTIISDVVTPLGYAIAWEPMNLTLRKLQTSFGFEACGITFSKNISNLPRAVMAQRQSLSGGIASVSVSWKRRTKGKRHVIFQGGAAPMILKVPEPGVPLFKFDTLYEKSPGKLDGVPLLSSLGLFTHDPNSVSAQCTHCQLCVKAQLAYVNLDLQGVTQLIGAVLSFMKEFSAALLGKPASTPKSQSLIYDAKDGNLANSISTSWSFIIDGKANGCDVRVNEALQLKLSQVSLISIEKEADPQNSTKPGGVLNLEFAAKKAILFASNSGSLKDIQDPMVLSTEKVGMSVEFSHEVADFQHNYAFNVMFHASSTQSSLSRLKLLYLLKFPKIEVEALLHEVATHDASHLYKSDSSEGDSGLSVRCRWFCRLGAQLDHVDFSCAADIYHLLNGQNEHIRAVVNGKMLSINVAARISNYHPTKNHLHPTMREKLTDIQVSIGNIQVVEKLQHAWINNCSRLGDFSRLPDNAFLCILVCLDLRDLKCMSGALHVVDTNICFDQDSIPLAMLSWHLTSSITKRFQKINAKWQTNNADKSIFFVEIPLVVAWNDPAIAKDPHSFPMLSWFYRNYSEAGPPHQVIAGSMESVDFVMTTSSCYCLASVFDVRCKNVISSPIDTKESVQFGKTSVSTMTDQLSHSLTSRVSLADLEVSLLLGQVRMIFPNENLMNFVQATRPVITGNVIVVLESMSIVSAIRNDISLDGLGYPPFNSRTLPRRPTVQAQRFGQSQLRMGCKAGKISGFVAELNLSSEVSTPTNIIGLTGPFENYIGTIGGHLAQFTNAEAFWSPLNVTCSIGEEVLANCEDSDIAVKITASIAMTKLRLQLNKRLFDVLYTRFAGLCCGIERLKRSIATGLTIKLRPFQTEGSSELSTKFTSTKQREITFSGDGIDINVVEIDRSIHLRVGSIVLVHNSSTLSGSASIQNLVVGHRISEKETETVAMEEVVFGAKAEPSLWQLAVENYPDKLIAARWNFGDRSEGTLFLDIQAYQLHVSHHFICALARFFRTESDPANCSRWKQIGKECNAQPEDRKPFMFQKRWNVKFILAPSVMSYWKQHSSNARKSGVWMTSGQLFASVGVGCDEVAQQIMSSYGSGINEINRFIAVPTLKFMLNLDKFGLNISDDFPPLIVHFQKHSINSITTPTSSTWSQFVKYISIVSEAQRFLHDCSVRVTGDQHQVLEQNANKNEIMLLRTGITRTNILAEVNALCMKLSYFSLGAIRSLLTALGENCSTVSSINLPDNWATSDDVVRRSFVSQKSDESSIDDFNNLKRMAESRRPLPGELVFTEALLIETQSDGSEYVGPIMGSKVHIQIDPNQYNIKLADVTAYLQVCNKPWNMEEHCPSNDRSSYPGFTNRTHSWMGMRWCYHIPRKICKIVADPVPLPPNGVPSAWPSWNWKQDQENNACRLCDILCQLRCWDSKNSSYVVIGEFFVPWEQLSSTGISEISDDVNEFGSFGKLMNQWFDDNMEETLYQRKLLEFGAQTRTYLFDNELPSDNWELRWRTPLQSEHDPENKQIRLLINALLASSLRVHSVLIFDAFQRVVSSITFPQVSLSASHVGPENDSHDIITAELNEAEISCVVVGSAHTRALVFQVSSVLQVYLNNMAQLLTVSLIPRTTIDALIDISAKGIEVSTLIGPVSLYLNQTSMLVLTAIPKLLLEDQKPFRNLAPYPDEKLSSMRIRIANYTGVNVWYRQKDTSECLYLPAEASAAYSWLSLASSPYYQLCFALNDPQQKRCEVDKKEANKQLSEQEESSWCDPCRIKENCVTGRYFSDYGFVWVCVELRGLQTTVLLRSSLTVLNYCDFSVRIKVNQDAAVYNCAKSTNLHEDASAIQESVTNLHPHCISLDGSACILSTSLQSDGNFACIMTESVATISFSIDGGYWCNVEAKQKTSSEFDLVKANDTEAEAIKNGQCQFKPLQYKDLDGPTQYVWAKIARIQCKTLLPTDFNPIQPQVCGRYTWMEMSVWPAIIVQNIIDASVVLSFSQKSTIVKLKLPPSHEKCLSTLNPFEPVKIELEFDQDTSRTNTHINPLSLLLQFNISEERKEQIFVFKDCRVVASFCNGRGPMIRIRTERAISIANMTPSNLKIRMAKSYGDRDEALENIDSCGERSIGFAAISDHLVIAIAIEADPCSKEDRVDWSPQVSLDAKGDIKPIVVPAARTGLRSLASAFCIELVNSKGYLKLIIHPQVVVVNATNCNLNCVPTDGQGNALAVNDKTLLVSEDTAGWSVPVCLHIEAKKRSITADVSSWLSSKLSRRSSETGSNINKQIMMTRLSCSFRIRIAEDGYEWTEEIAVLLPKLHIVLTLDGKLEHVEPPTSSAAPANTQERLYPPPSTTTYRRRLLVRHHSFKHKMLTYTMTQTGKSIQVTFFVDHQPPVIIHNQWQNMLAFRNVSFPSDPEGIGANFCLEYDWCLQVSAKICDTGSEQIIADDKKLDAESKLLSDWLEASSQISENAGISDIRTTEHTRFQIGSPRYGWSNVLWQIGGIQFASFFNEKENASTKLGPTFLIMSFYRAGSWLISINCLEDPTSDSLAKSPPSLVFPSAVSSVNTMQITPPFLKVGMVVEELSLHFCDEHDPICDARGMILYPEVLRATCKAVSIVFATAPDPPEISRLNTRLGYLSHIRSYTTLFVAVEHIEVGHFLQACNFPVIFWFPESHAKKPLLQFDRVKKHKTLESLMNKLLDIQLPGAEDPCFITRVIYAGTRDPTNVPPYFHSIEVKLAPAILQVEDDILAYVNMFVQPICAALEGEAVCRAMHGIETRTVATKGDAWSALAYKSALIMKQRRVYIEYLKISDLQVTITARISIPVLNSFDGTPLYFGCTEMRGVFSFPDQLLKDLAANYVADTIVRSPMLLMSLNIFGNPAGFLRSFGQGVRDLVEIPLAASRNGYNPWVLTKGVLGGVASFLSHTTAATLTSVSGFSYSVSRTMDQLTLPSDQLRKRHYTRSTQLSSALADGLGSLGSSVVGAAAGVVTTPIAVYKERQMQGLDTGFQNVVGSVGMGLVGIVARPMGGIASLVSLASDGLLYGMGESRTPFNDSMSRFDAKSNELLRYKLKVLSDAIGSYLVFAHGLWINPNGNSLLIFKESVDYISREKFKKSENELLRSLLLSRDTTHELVQVAVVCSNEFVYVVGVTAFHNQAVLARTSLKLIEAVEENLKEPTVFDLGIKTSASVEWLRFRLPPPQRRNLSHQLRLWLAEDSNLYS